MRHSAFTLVELLVVITILVILLALLVPAVDKAVYQAELAVCGARFKGIGTASITYTADHKRAYFHRWIRIPGTNGRPNLLSSGGHSYDPRFDDRAVMETVMDLSLLVDPLSVRISLKSADNPGNPVIYTSTPIWAGWQYAGHKGMLRLGDRFTAVNNYDRTDPAVYSFNILAADLDQIANTLSEFRAAHPDHEGKAYSYVHNNQTPISGPTIPSVNWPHVQSQWAANSPPRGKVDQHYLADDGRHTLDERGATRRSDKGRILHQKRHRHT